MLRKILSLVILATALISCNNDKASTDNMNELPKEKREYIEKYGNPDEQHDHADKPTAIENNSRVSVPVENKTKESKTSASTDDNSQRSPYSSMSESRPPSKQATIKEANSSIQQAKRPVPHACDVLNPKIVAKTIGVDQAGISVKDGSSKASPYAKSCFFRWEHRGIPNSGVLLQIQDNPVPDEFPEWPAYYIQAKKTEGEKAPDGSLEYKYNDFSGVGVDGAYNFELHRYMWRDAKGFVYLIAFNLPASESEELEWARKIGTEVMKKLN